MAHNTPTIEEDRQPLLDALTEADSALADALAAIETLPAGPTPEAESAVERYRADLEEVRSGLGEHLVGSPPIRPRISKAWLEWTS